MMLWRKKIVLIILMCMPFMVGAQKQQVIIDVKGMTCPLCVSIINKALRGTEGVIKAKSYMNKHEAVVIVPADFELQRLIDAIEPTGYKGTIRSVEQLDASASVH